MTFCALSNNHLFLFQSSCKKKKEIVIFNQETRENQTTIEVDTIVWQTLKCDKDVKEKPRPPAVHFYVSVHYGKIYMQFFINP